MPRQREANKYRSVPLWNFERCGEQSGELLGRPSFSRFNFTQGKN
jgi:hypothetical protein